MTLVSPTTYEDLLAEVIQLLNGQPASPERITVQYADEISVYITGVNIPALSASINSYFPHLLYFLKERETMVSPEKSVVTLFTPTTMNSTYMIDFIILFTIYARFATLILKNPHKNLKILHRKICLNRQFLHKILDFNYEQVGFAFLYYLVLVTFY